MNILVFIGPSGSGKSTVARELHRRSVIAVTPSWTTRPRREDEAHSTVEHRFVSEEEFDALERDRFFLEVVTMFALPYRYGLPPIERPPDGVVPAIMLRAPLLDRAAVHYPNRFVYQIETPSEIASRRVLARGAAEGTRVGGYTAERDLGRVLAHRVFESRTRLSQVVDAVEHALREDFRTERSEPI